MSCVDDILELPIGAACFPCIWIDVLVVRVFDPHVEGLAEKVDTTITGFNGVVDQLNESDIKGLVSSFKELVENINDPDGSINKLMKDDSVYNSVDSLLNDVNILVKKIPENPKKYLKISVF